MTDNNYALTKLYHPSGALISIPIDLGTGLTLETGALLLSSIDNLIKAGFSASLPGLEEGELMEEMSALARREGQDLTPIIDFYSSNTRLEKKFMHVYLNSPEDATAFEQASGLKVDQLTIYDGKTAIERNDRNASKYIVQLKASMKLVYKISPKWDQWKQAGGEGQEPHKRLLVRYEAARKASNSEPSPEVKTEISEEPGNRQYEKLSGDLVTMIVKKMGVKPSLITPILAKLPGKTISFESALKLVESNLNKESL